MYVIHIKKLDFIFLKRIFSFSQSDMENNEVLPRTPQKRDRKFYRNGNLILSMLFLAACVVRKIFIEMSYNPKTQFFPSICRLSVAINNLSDPANVDAKGFGIAKTS